MNLPIEDQERVLQIEKIVVENNRNKAEIVLPDLNIVMTNLFVVNKHIAYKEFTEHILSGELPQLDNLKEKITAFMNKHNSKSLAVFFKPTPFTQLINNEISISSAIKNDRQYTAKKIAEQYGYDNVYRIHPKTTRKSGEYNKTGKTIYCGIECSIEDLPKLILGSHEIQKELAIVYFGAPL
jgi:hypothetical protein